MAIVIILITVTAMAIIFFFHILKNQDEKLTAEEFANFKCESSSATNLLDSEYIEAIALRKWKKILAWVAFHSDQVSREDVKGQTILHHAALFRAPTNVMEFLLWAAPDTAKVPNNDGELALHWAVRLSSPSPILALLLDAYPESAFVADFHGSTPMSLLWEKHQMPLLHSWRLEKQRLLDETNGVWKKIMVVYRTLHEQKIRDDGENTTSHFHPLHLAAAHPSPPCLFPLMIQIYNDEVKKRDQEGRLPLFVACENPVANSSCDVLTKIQLLLREYPVSAKLIDPKTCRYPLSLSLASGVLWSEGVKSLIRAFPTSLQVRDPESNLLPFALAAIPKSSARTQVSSHILELDTIYNVLRTEPSVLKLCGF